MASVAAGNYAGVAKGANIVSIKKNTGVQSVMRGLGMIMDDVEPKRDKDDDGMLGRAVINLSVGQCPVTAFLLVCFENLTYTLQSRCGPINSISSQPSPAACATD